MKRYTWRTDERGIVRVTAPGELEHAPTLGMQEARTMDAVIGRWEPLAAKHAARVGCPKGWILAMIWRESGGNPMAVNPEDRSTPADDGLGLMQLTFKYFHGNHSRTELMDPELNVAIGADYIDQLSRKYAGDFPKVSAAYNAGSARPSELNPFGMVSTGNHIEAEVAALNYYLMRSLPHEITGPVRVISDEEVMAQVSVGLSELGREAAGEAVRPLDDGSDPVDREAKTDPAVPHPSRPPQA